MALDLLVRQARRAEDRQSLVDIAIADGRIVDIAQRISADAPAEDVEGRLVIPGFVESHIHLDKSRILELCRSERGTLEEAIASVAAAKRSFTEADIYARAQQTLEQAIIHGTTRMRTHVEIDPRVGLNGFNAVCRLKRDYAWAIDLQICAFPQEGLINDPGAEELLVQACEQGADLIGGCPYTDSDPHRQIARIFDIAHRFNVDIDFHLDFDIDPTWMHLDEVCRQTDAYHWGGRVTVGHVTKLSAIDHSCLAVIGRRLADCGVAVTVLPATDLFLMGRDRELNVPRGVAPAHRLLAAGVSCSLATNNVLNPFTPFGDCSLIRMANLYANVAHIGRERDLCACFDMITRLPALLMNASDYGIAVGHPADLVVLESRDPASAVAELAQPLFALKRGRRSFTRAAATLHRP
jgi:cytosine deaminase